MVWAPLTRDLPLGHPVSPSNWAPHISTALVREIAEAPEVGWVLHGEIGVGKTTLLQAVAQHLRQCGNSPVLIVGSNSENANAADRPSSTAHNRFGDPEPHVVLVDDAPSMGPKSTAALIEGVVSGRVARVVLTARTSARLPEDLVSLATKGGVIQRRIDRLSPDDVQAVVCSNLGGEVHPAVTACFWDLCRGNPMVLRLTLEAALDGGSVGCMEGMWQLLGRLDPSPVLGDILMAEATDLGQAMADTLELVALAGATPLPRLASLGLDTAVGPLLSAGLLERSLVNPSCGVRSVEAPPGIAHAVASRAPRHSRATLMASSMEGVQRGDEPTTPNATGPVRRPVTSSSTGSPVRRCRGSYANELAIPLAHVRRGQLTRARTLLSEGQERANPDGTGLQEIRSVTTLACLEAGDLTCLNDEEREWGSRWVRSADSPALAWLHACVIAHGQLLAGRPVRALGWLTTTRLPVLATPAIALPWVEATRALALAWTARRYEPSDLTLDSLGPEGAWAQGIAARAHGHILARSGQRRAALAHLREQAIIAAERDDLLIAAWLWYDRVRLGVATREGVAALQWLGDGDLADLRVAHAQALHRRDIRGLEEAALGFESHGLALYASEAYAHAAGLAVDEGRNSSAHQFRQHIALLTPQREGITTPAISDLARPLLLTPRELEIAQIVATGLSSKAAGAHLGVSYRTVDNVLYRVYDKLGITSRGDLVRALA